MEPLVSYINYLPYLGDWALLALRVFLGALFITHGFPKAKSLSGTIQWFGSMGFKPGWFWAPLVTLLELGGGMLLVVGFWTPFIAFLLMGQFMVINFWKIFRHEPFVGGIEFDLLILCSLFVLLAFGPGGFSLDYIF